MSQTSGTTTMPIFSSRVKTQKEMIRELYTQYLSSNDRNDIVISVKKEKRDLGKLSWDSPSVQEASMKLADRLMGQAKDDPDFAALRKQICANPRELTTRLKAIGSFVVTLA